MCHLFKVNITSQVSWSCLLLLLFIVSKRKLLLFLVVLEEKVLLELGVSCALTFAKFGVANYAPWNDLILLFQWTLDCLCPRYSELLPYWRNLELFNGEMSEVLDSHLSLLGKFYRTSALPRTIVLVKLSWLADKRTIRKEGAEWMKHLFLHC